MESSDSKVKGVAGILGGTAMVLGAVYMGPVNCMIVWGATNALVGLCVLVFAD